MKISVIVPCYNAASYIEKAIRSFANQTFHDFEVIFVDDVSTDNTVEVVHALIEKYKIRGWLLKNEKNTGPSLARRLGISNSRAEYCAFCDSDDWYDKTYLSEMYNATLSGEIDIVFCNYRLVYSDGKTIDKDMLGDVSVYSDKKSVMTVGVDGFCGGLFRRELFDNMTFPEIRNGEDMALIPVLIGKAKKYGFVKKPIYNYYQRVGSLSITSSDKVIQSLQDSFEYTRKSLDREKYAKEIEYIGVRNVLYGAILALFKSRYSRTAFFDILRGFEIYYPNWYMNLYLKRLPIYKRIFLFCVKRKWILFLALIARIHTKIVS